MNKYKILMLCDHPLSTSGVACESRYIIDGLLKTNKYSFRVLGGAVKHADYSICKVNENFIIKPVDGFGSVEMIRVLLATEKPDCMLLFTDPRFFLHVFEHENEIHQTCPIIFNTIWDQFPVPKFNREIYSSCDALNCINTIAYDSIKEILPEHPRVRYVPHAIPRDVYFPFPEEQRKQTRDSFFGCNSDKKFIGLWVGRNARRKRPNDMIEAWSLFIKELKEKHHTDDALLIFHSDPVDMQEGSNLHATVDLFKMQKYITFSPERVPFEHMNALFNSVDFVVNNSSAEGFGLPTLEAMMCAKPIAAVTTGGLTKQVINDDGTENGVAIPVACRNLVGSMIVPYIYESYCSNEGVAAALMKMYEFGPEKRKQLGLQAREHALKDYNIDSMISSWDASLTELIESWRSNRPSVYQPWKAIEI